MGCGLACDGGGEGCLVALDSNILMRSERDPGLRVSTSPTGWVGGWD